ncbi:MAG: right-handed parallel beta-helix repeat-containing protein [Kofleriaceae bacterium]
MMRTALLMFVVGIGWIGCYKDNPAFDPDAGMSCSSSADCAGDPGRLACDVSDSKTCVQCTAAEPAACTGRTPVCGAGKSCRACEAHDECSSKLCLPDGSCAAGDKVAYVAPVPVGSANDMCSMDMPCTEVAKALQRGLPYIKIQDTIDELVSIRDQNVALFGDGPQARLKPTKPGIVVKIEGASEVEIYDLAITGGLGVGGIGVATPVGSSVKLSLVRSRIASNAGGGIVTSNSNVTLSRCLVLENTLGGLALSGGSFDVTNTYIARNGGAASSFGGVQLTNMTVGTHRFEFNTVTANSAMVGTSGVVCALVNQPIGLSNNIVYGNLGAGAGTQVSGANCTWTYSDIGPDPLQVSGEGILNVDPAFSTSGAQAYSLSDGSMVKDMADPNATLMIDFDGDARPQGARRDMGADEVKGP